MGNKNKDRRIKEVTLADIAKATGVSIMTVTRAVHGWKGVHYDVRERVLKIAEKLGYAASRCSYKVNDVNHGDKLTVGVLVPRINCFFYARVIEGVDRWLETRGCRLIIGCAYDSSVKDGREFSLMLEQRVDGIIWCPTMDDVRVRRMVSLASRQNCPVVFFDRAPEVQGVDSVVTDDRKAMFKLVKTLVDSGRRNIAYLSADDQYSVARERMTGYRECLETHGMKLDPKNVISLAVPSTVAADEAVAKMLKRRKRPDAISAYNDTLAIGAELAVLKAGLRIPEDVAITGFSSLPETELAAIPISTMRQDMMSIGRAAARMLLSRIKENSDSLEGAERMRGKKRTGSRKVIPAQLLLRGSTFVAK